MARFLCVLLAGLTLCSVAEAKVLVVYREYDNTAGTYERKVQSQRTIRLVTQTLKTLGVDYKMARANIVKTEFARTGTMVWNYGTSGAYTETFDAVIHIPVGMGTTVQNAAGECRPDSILLTARGGPTVPQLYVADNAITTAGTTTFMASTACCTTGVANAQSIITPPAGQGGFQNGTTTPMIFGAYVAGWPLAKPHSSGLRKHIIARYVAYAIRPNHIHDFAWADSMDFTVASTDSVLMWEIPFTNITGAKPVVVCGIGGGGAAADSLYDAAVVDYRPVTENDVSVLLMGLARIDSIAGGAVLGKNKLPLQIALTIDNALSRGKRNGPGGILPSDTSAYYATLDSIAALDVPVTFGVNADPDTIAAYERDVIKLKSIPKARFTPQIMSGVDSSTAMLEGNASSRRPLDVLGRFRRRAAYGDGSKVGADTSVYGLLMRARHYSDSTFGANRASRTILPPKDDWSPKNLTNGQSSPGLDSLFWAFKKAGFKAVRTNVQHRDAKAGYIRANPLGYYGEQMVATGKVGTAESDPDSNKYQMKLVGHSGYSISSRRQGVVGNDSTAAHTTGFHGTIYVELARMWYGATQDYDKSYDWSPYDYFTLSSYVSGGWIDVDLPSADKVYAARRSNVKVWHASDFSGTPNGPPALVGWWAMKSIVNAAKTINRLAGRTIVGFCYPEDIALEK